MLLRERLSFQTTIWLSLLLQVLGISPGILPRNKVTQYGFQGKLLWKGNKFFLIFLWTEFRLDTCTNNSLLPESYFLNPWTKCSKSKWASKVADGSGARGLYLKSEQVALWHLHAESGARNEGSGRAQRSFWSPRGEWGSLWKAIGLTGHIRRTSKVRAMCSAQRHVVSVGSTSRVTCVMRRGWAFLLRVFGCPKALTGKLLAWGALFSHDFKVEWNCLMDI